MALFQGEIEKVFQGEYWVNRYHVEAADLGAAAVVLGQIVPLERAVTLPGVTFTKLSIRTTTVGDDIYFTNPLNVAGLADSQGDMLALFNTVRVDLGAAAGRPSRKYLRAVLGEASASFNSIAANIISDVQTKYATPLAALAGYVDVDGDEITSASVYPLVQIRQLRRGSKKKNTQSSGGTQV